MSRANQRRINFITVNVRRNSKGKKELKRAKQALYPSMTYFTSNYLAKCCMQKLFYLSYKNFKL